MAVEIHRCELDGMARERANIGAEAAAGIGDGVVPDAESRGLGVGPVGHLEQADGAGGGLVERERIKTPSPAPIGAIHRIARALDLRQRGQEFGRDRMGGVSVEQRPVLPPRLRRFLVEPVADEEEQLGWLVDHVIDQVRQREDRQHDRDAASDPNRPRYCREFLPRPSCAQAPAAKEGGKLLLFLGMRFVGVREGTITEPERR